MKGETKETRNSLSDIRSTQKRKIQRERERGSKKKKENKKKKRFQEKETYIYENIHTRFLTIYSAFLLYMATIYITLYFEI